MSNKSLACKENKMSPPKLVPVFFPFPFLRSFSIFVTLVIISYYYLQLSRVPVRLAGRCSALEALTRLLVVLSCFGGSKAYS